MDLRPLENQPTLDDAYNVIIELLPFIQPNELVRLPRHPTDDIEFYVEGGILDISGDQFGAIFYPLVNGQWLVRIQRYHINDPLYAYIIDEEDIISWISSYFGNPRQIEVRLNSNDLTYVVWSTYRDEEE